MQKKFPMYFSYFYTDVKTTYVDSSFIKCSINLNKLDNLVIIGKKKTKKN